MTICDICHTNPATLKLTQIINDEKSELNLCKQCADEKGLANPLGGIPSAFGAMVIGIISAQMPEQARTVSSVKCERCGTSKADFEGTGLLGCGECYEAFKEDLKFILRRIHGSNKHIGHRPVALRETRNLPDATTLRRKLQLAVEKEDFEEAARLRDLIADAEAKARYARGTSNGAPTEGK